MLPSHIMLVDRYQPLVAAWARAFSKIAAVSAEERDFFAQPADAMVSPANSFGIMDGGLDLAIRGELGVSIQRTVQARIVEAHHGEIAVGQAEVVETGDGRWP